LIKRNSKEIWREVVLIPRSIRYLVEGGKRVEGGGESDRLLHGFGAFHEGAGTRICFLNPPPLNWGFVRNEVERIQGTGPQIIT